ncbi:MAG: hypothetical protein TREMPRED_001933 [Tremellales sp. Tagirdzhanova-0007]|nr:MAG: hypothetical protein TREMPRED_001933 [Tremellales sp. Tagirdzhanova-0007]
MILQPTPPVIHHSSPSPHSISTLGTSTFTNRLSVPYLSPLPPTTSTISTSTSTTTTNSNSTSNKHRTSSLRDPLPDATPPGASHSPSPSSVEERDEFLAHQTRAGRRKEKGRGEE